MTDEEREARNAEDRKWLDKFDRDMKRLTENRKNVPLQQLQTRYARAYNTLVAEVECDADWWCKRYLECLSFPKHPNDPEERIAHIESQISAILREERKPGGTVERYKAALVQNLDREKFQQLVWEIHRRLEVEVYRPYWRSHCSQQPDGRWFNDIIKRYWTPPGDGHEYGWWGNGNERYCHYPSPHDKDDADLYEEGEVSQ